MNREILLKTSDIAQFSSVHDWLKSTLKLPAHYGANLDALWDCITSEINLPLTVLWLDDDNSGGQYAAITDLFEEAAGVLEHFEFGYLLDDE